MAQGFGNPKGPHYGLGRINVPVPGTPQQLNQNFSTNEPFSGQGGVFYSLVFNTLTFKAPVANVGTVFICFKGGSKANLNSVVADLAPGASFVLSTAFPQNAFAATEYVVDANSANDGVFVTGVAI